MSKKIYFINVQPDPEGPIQGHVWDVTDFQKMQDYAHGHIDQVVKSLLMKAAASALVDGFAYALAGGLQVSIAAGSIFSTDGKTYDLEAQQTVAMGAADPNNPRIDVIYALIESDTQVNLLFRSFRQARNNGELAAGVPLYPQIPQQVPTELHTKATINVKAGVPGANPQLPALAANEIPLFRVHVAAGQQNLANGDLTDVRVNVRSLSELWSQYDLLVLNLGETIDDRVAGLVTPDSGLAKVYDDVGNLLRIGPDYVVLDARFVNVNGDTMTGALMLNLGFSAPKVLSKLGNQAPFLAAARLFTIEDGQAAFTKDAGVDLAIPLVHFNRESENFTNPVVLRVSGNANTDVALDTPGLLDVLGTNPGMPTSVATSLGVLLSLRGTNATLTGLATVFRVRAVGDAYLSRHMQIAGNLSVTGSISKGSGTFLIDHPLHPDTKDLMHAFVESPRDQAIYSGVVQVPAGQTEFDVDIDAASNMESGTFAAIMHNAGAMVQCRGFLKSYGEVLPGTGTLRIHLENPSSGEFFSWFVIAERNDPFIKQAEGHDADGHLVVERDKPLEANRDAMLAPQTRIITSDTPADERIENEVVPDLIGTHGFARHAQQTGIGTVPTHQVTIRTVVKEGAE